MGVLNLTPHPCTVVDSDGKVIVEIEPSGATLRVEEDRENAGWLTLDGAGVPAVSVEYGGLEINGDIGIDAVRKADICYVSGIVGSAIDGFDGEVADALRDGTVATSGELVREDGTPIGVRDVEIVC